ncbi:hypothetical protein [Aedoeadaptatus coxii]|uniref:hypothetical protein n=1 Tax=Aedoeadaptatus coxii TaxID=755172 RepID=UPI002AD4D827|nr:hypothetical protein [Peptoniphilus coxii]
MSDFKFVLNRSGVRELLQSGPMKTVVETHASGIRARCGVEYAQDSYVGKTRVNAMVYPATPHAYFSNLKHNTLLKALR